MKHRIPTWWRDFLIYFGLLLLLPLLAADQLAEHGLEAPPVTRFIYQAY